MNHILDLGKPKLARNVETKIENIAKITTNP